jgi:GNAT superfamily N-acetyltransferase
MELYGVEVYMGGSSRIKVIVSSRLRAPDGQDAGTFTREFMNTKDGLIAFHENFMIHPEYQGKGFAKDLIKYTDELYQKIGVTKIVAEANLQVGGYAWANYGFDFASPSSAKMVRERIARVMVDQDYAAGRLQGDKETHVESYMRHPLLKGAKHSWDFAGLRYNGEHVGKKGMLGTAWKAVRSCDPDSVSWKLGTSQWKARK